MSDYIDYARKAKFKSHDEIRQRMLQSTKSNCFRNSVGETILDLTEDDFFDFDTVAELEEYSKVKLRTSCQDFYRLSKSPPPKGMSLSDDEKVGSWTLMAEFNDGYKWWVIGWFAHGEKVDLPVFEAKF